MSESREVTATEQVTKKKKSLVREYVEAIIIAVLLALLIRTFVVQASTIPSGSMIPTLLVGDYILVNKFIYRFKEPLRGDVIVFKYPWDEKRDFIKRVIGMGGEEVGIKGQTVFVNGRPLDDLHAYFSDSSQTQSEYGPVVVPAGSYFVMGDNR